MNSIRIVLAHVVKAIAFTIIFLTVMLLMPLAAWLLPDGEAKKILKEKYNV